MLFMHDGRKTITLPGDALHTAPYASVYPAVEDVPAPRETRFVFDGVRWKAVER